MDLNGIQTFVKEKPYIAVGAGVVAAGAAALAFVHRGAPSAPQTGASGIYDSTDTVSVNKPVVVDTQYVPSLPPPVPTSPAPIPKPSSGKHYYGDTATLPKGMGCPNGSTPIYDKRKGTYAQTNGNILCEFHDGRTQAPKPIKVK